MIDPILAILENAERQIDEIHFCDDFYDRYRPEECSVAMRHPEKNLENHWGFPFDHNMIASVPAYINASPMSIGAHCYIAAQGPRRNTFEEFWEMVWQERSSLIVSVTNETEIWNGSHVHLKFHRFWPEETPLKLENCHIRLDAKSVAAEWRDGREEKIVLRQLTLSKNGEVRTVYHLHMENWPDNGIIRAESLVALSKEVDRLKMDGPIVVHCAAGVGRTGTLIAFHSLYHDILALLDGREALLDPKERILSMRKMRWGAIVAAPSQYELLIEALKRAYQELN